MLDLLPPAGTDQPELSAPGPSGHAGRGHDARRVAMRARALLLPPMVLIALLAGVGWLYVFRGLGWFGFGRPVHDALPLLQLAGFDRQPLARVMVAWLLSGVMLALPLRRTPRLRRILVVASLGLALLLVASQASFALTRNLNFTHVLSSRTPGSGPWLEALMLTMGCALLGRARGRG
jgi:hypothetical protein